MITDKDFKSLCRNVSSILMGTTDIDPRDIVQQAALRVLQCGRDFEPCVVYGFARHELYHELDKRRVRIRYATERMSWLPSTDYDHVPPGEYGDLSIFPDKERENILKLLHYADRKFYNHTGKKNARKHFPSFVIDYLRSATKPDDARRETARKTSTIQPKERL